MNLTVMRHSVDYLYKTCVAGSAHPEQIPYYPQKGAVMPPEAAPEMPRLYTPETVGISSRTMDALLHTLEGQPGTHLHHLLVERGGRLIVAASAPGYSPRIPTLTHSMAKSITSFAVGLLIGDGKLHLTDRLVDIFRDELPTSVSPRMKRMTLRHLLTMSAGVTDINEAASVTIADWKRAFLSSRPAFEPGTDFFYNSMNSYMLAAAVEKIGGRHLEDILAERVFTPLGITQYLIERAPDGVAKGGWGMYFAPIDLMKFGRMIADGGVWRGKQILPADYVAEATTAQMHVRDVFGAYDYGYHLWVAKDGSACLFNGMMGQNMWCGKNGVVALYTSGNSEFFCDAATLAEITAAVGEDFPTRSLLPSPSSVRALRRTEQNFFCARSGVTPRGRHEDLFSPGKAEEIPDAVRTAAGVFRVERNNMSFMPFVWRMIQNSHTPGIVSVGFAAEGEEMTLTVTEGETVYRLPCGYGTYRYATVMYKEEPYFVGTLCTLAPDEDGETVLRFSLVFPELPNSRRIKIHCVGNGQAVVSLSEAPGISLIGVMLTAFVNNAGGRPNIYAPLRRHIGDRVVRDRVLHCMEPVLYATSGEEEKAAGRPPRLAGGILRERLGKLTTRAMRRRRDRDKE